MPQAPQPQDFDGDVAFMTEPIETRVGLMALGTDLVVEGVFADTFRDVDARVFVNRVVFENPVTMETLAAMDADLERCVENILPGLPLDVVAYGCSAGTVAIGEAQLEKRIQAVKPGAKTTNPVTAAATAFHTLGAKRISILTPYSKEVNANVSQFFMDKDLDVLNITGFGVPSDLDIARITDDTIKAGARAVKHADADALFLSCTGLRAAHVAGAIEAELGVPVVTSNQAMAWHALRLAGFDVEVPGFGQLLTMPLAA